MCVVCGTVLIFVCGSAAVCVSVMLCVGSVCDMIVEGLPAGELENPTDMIDDQDVRPRPRSLGGSHSDWRILKLCVEPIAFP